MSDTRVVFGEKISGTVVQFPSLHCLIEILIGAAMELLYTSSLYSESQQQNS